MKLIIDSGATNTEWVVLDGDRVAGRFISKGFNPFYTKQEEIEQVAREALTASMHSFKINKIYFYGTGCSTPENCNIIRDILNKFFPEAAISVYHDLQAAAVALLRNKKGIACILGTGSNSCLWDGKQIVENVPSLGYLLGDEGSAIYLGKLLLKKILGGKADDEITRSFYQYVGMNFSEVLHKIYRDIDVKRWIGSLSFFVSEHIHHPQIKEIAKRNFQDFLTHQVSEYSGFRDVEISFLGSIAYYLQDVLKEVMEDSGLKTGVIMQSPMEGLIDYYGGYKDS